MVALQLLGGFRAFGDDGQAVALPDRARVLLACLAAADAPVQRSALAAFLTPDESEQEQRRVLRQVLYVVRQALGKNAILCTEQGDLSLNEPIVIPDTREFWKTVTAEDEQHLFRAIELYRGPFLDGETGISGEFEDWLRARRAEFLEATVRALIRFVRLQMSQRAFDRALTQARKAVHLDPFCEEAHRQVIVCLSALGGRGTALRHLESTRQLFSDELGVELDAETVELRRLLEAGRTVGLSEIRPLAPMPLAGPSRASSRQLFAAGTDLLSRKRTGIALTLFSLACFSTLR